MIAKINMTIRDYLQEYTPARDLIENSMFDYPSTEKIVNAGMNTLFNFRTVWYTTDKTEDGLLVGYEEFKELFCFKFIDMQPKTETFAMFKDRLFGRMLEVMATYSELYKTLSMDYDPLVNRTYRQVSAEDDKLKNIVTDNTDQSTTNITSGTNSNSSFGKSDSFTEVENTKNNQDINSDNPQVNFSGVDYASTMTRGKEDQAGKNDTVENVNTSDEGSNRVSVNGGNVVEKVSNTNQNVERDSVTEFVGFVGNDKTENLIRFREAIVNINQLLLSEFDDLFGWYYGGGVTLMKNKFDWWWY